MSTECERLSEHLSAFADGELGEPDAAEVSGHLKDCKGCQTALDQLRMIGAAAGTISAPEVTESEWAAGWDHIAAAIPGPECDRHEELVSGYVDEQLGDEEARAMGSHLTGCEHCRALVEDYRSVDGLAGKGAAPEVRQEEWDERWQAISEAIPPARPSEASRISRFWPLAWVAAAAGVALILWAFHSFGPADDQPTGIALKSERAFSVESIDTRSSGVIFYYSEEADLSIVLTSD